MAPSRPSTAKSKKHGFGSTITKSKRKVDNSIPPTESLPQYYELTNKNVSKEEKPKSNKIKTLKKANITTKKKGLKIIDNKSKNIPTTESLPQYHELSSGNTVNKGISKKKTKPKVNDSYLGIISQHQKQNRLAISCCYNRAPL